MKIRLYFDEDSMDRNLLRTLNARGVDVITALDAGMINRSDEEHLDFASSQERVLCTFNVGDFMRLHKGYLAQGKQHTGIILASQQRYSIGEYMRRLLKLMSSKAAEEMYDQVEFLSAWG